MKKLTFSRLRSGFYQSEGTTMLGDEETEVTVFVRRQDEWSAWSVEVYRKGNECSVRGLVGLGDAVEPTYRDAKATAALILDRGFTWISGLGWCAA